MITNSVVPLSISITRWSISFSMNLYTRRKFVNQFTNNRQEVNVFSRMKLPSLIRFCCQDPNSMVPITKWVSIRLIAYLIMKATVTWILFIMRKSPILFRLRDYSSNCTTIMILKTINVSKIEDSSSSNLFSKWQKSPRTNSKIRHLRNMLLWVRSWEWMIPMLSYQEAPRWPRSMTLCQCSLKGIRALIQPSLTLRLLFQGAPPLRNNFSITRVL